MGHGLRDDRARWRRRRGCGSRAARRSRRGSSCWPTAAPTRGASRASPIRRRTTARSRSPGRCTRTGRTGGRAYERFTPRGRWPCCRWASATPSCGRRRPPRPQRILALDDARVPRRAAGALRRSRGPFRGGRAAGLVPAQAADHQLHDRAAHGDRRQRGAGHASDRRAGAQHRTARRRHARRDPGGRSRGRSGRRGGCSRPIARPRRRDAGRGVAFTDFLVGAFMDDRRLPTLGPRGRAHAARPPAARAAPARRPHDPRRARRREARPR